MRLFHFGLRQKIILNYILLGIIPIILSGSLSYFAYSQDIQRNAEITLDYMQRQCTNDIHSRLRNYKNTMAGILTDKQVDAAVSQLGQPSDDLEADRLRLNSRLLSYATSSSGALSITYIATSLEYVTCSFVGAGTGHLKWQDSAFREKFLLPAGEDYSLDHYTLQRASDVAPYTYGGDTLYLSFPFHDRSSKKLYGVLVMEIPNSVILEGMVADLWGGMENIMVDRNGYILLSLHPELVGRNIDDQPYTDSGLYISRSRRIQNTRFIFYSFVSRRAVIRQVQGFRTWMALLIVALCLGFFTAMYLTMRRYTQSVLDVAKGIQLYGEGKHEIDLPVRTNDEISVIADRFNRMARENNALLQNLQNQNRHIAFMTDQRRKSEIKALQAQINPHFLYNTLDTINWIAIDNDQREISSMITALGSLLRYSVSNIDQLVQLEAELRWCEKYVYLQQKRFDTLFDFRIEAGHQARIFPIHKMLLQPVLENCFVHGFEEMGLRQEDKRITLRCELRQDGHLDIYLRDNGSGIGPEVLARIRSHIAQPALSVGSGIGISNVINRMRLYYGDSGEIHIESSPGAGTVIHMVIPPKDTGLIEGDSDENCSSGG